MQVNYNPLSYFKELAMTPHVILIDIQEKLFPVMSQKDALLTNCLKFLEIAKELKFPILATEQNPDKLGTTLSALAKYPFSVEQKQAFSAYEVLQDKIPQGAPLFILGIEAHVCVLQTAQDFLKAGFTPTLLADCTSSRDQSNKQLALDHLRSLGARILSSEIVAFEAMRTYTHPSFKAISKIIK